LHRAQRERLCHAPIVVIRPAWPVRVVVVSHVEAPCEGHQSPAGPSCTPGDALLALYEGVRSPNDKSPSSGLFARYRVLKRSMPRQVRPLARQPCRKAQRACFYFDELVRPLSIIVLALVHKSFRVVSISGEKATYPIATPMAKAIKKRMRKHLGGRRNGGRCALYIRQQAERCRPLSRARYQSSCPVQGPSPVKPKADDVVG
jgi:hypothetical protein